MDCVDKSDELACAKPPEIKFSMKNDTATPPKISSNKDDLLILVLLLVIIILAIDFNHYNRISKKINSAQMNEIMTI